MRFIYIVLLALTIASCSKEIEVESVHFDVRAERSVYKVGDTVRFLFSGNPQNITFYSGKTGANYEFRDRTTIEGAIPKLSFKSVYGSGRQFNNMRLMATTHIESSTKEGILGAQWKDITERAIMPRDGWPVPANAAVESGIINLSDLVEDGKPLYLAFKHVGYFSPTIPVGTRLIQAFDVLAELPDGSTSIITNMLTAGWTMYDIKNPDRNWALNFTGPTPDIRFLGGAQNIPDIEDWVVTKPLFFNKTSPDIGRPIQYISGKALEQYEVMDYNEPGVYNVTFVATNVTVDDQKSVVKHLTITIEP